MCHFSSKLEKALTWPHELSPKFFFCYMVDICPISHGLLRKDDLKPIFVFFFTFHCNCIFEGILYRFTM